MTPKEQEWICEIAALNSASNTVTIAKICWKEIRRLRISQLRRMADACNLLFSRAIETSERRAPEFPPAERIIAINARVRRFRAACLAEIERLRGEG